jgi:hypothetical protein
MANVEFRQALGQVELCIEYLHEAGQSFQCAKAVAIILDNIIKDELRTKDTSSTHDETANDPSESTPVSSHPVPASVDVGNVTHLSGFGIQSSTAYMQFQVQPQSVPSWYESQPGDPTGHLTESAASFPCASSTQPMAQPHYGAPAPASFYPPFGMGLGMRGGETLSSWPFSPTQYHIDRPSQLLHRALNYDPNFLGLPQQQSTPGGPIIFPM